jgi:hypothetical protein
MFLMPFNAQCIITLIASLHLHNSHNIFALLYYGKANLYSNSTALPHKQISISRHPPPNLRPLRLSVNHRGQAGSINQLIAVLVTPSRSPVARSHNQ